MRILILGNMANDGYAAAKGMRKKNVDVNLAVNISDFGMALPEWEDGNISENIDPYSFSFSKTKKLWKAPDWIHYFDFKNRLSKEFHLLEKLKARIDLIRMIRGYDIVETHFPYTIYAQFSGISYVPYDAGAIREFPYHNDFYYKLGKRSYRKAKKILFTNPDTIPMFQKEKYIEKGKLEFVPFAIDPDKYKPVDASDLKTALLQKNEDFLIFSPSRQHWQKYNGKGNEKMIRAFAKFVKNFPNSRWVIPKWGLDVNKSEVLIKSLKIEEKITWINPLPKNKLIKYYNAADVVIDQAELGGWGTSTPEAMSCGTPTITSWAGKDRKNEADVVSCFGGSPPVLHGYYVDEIFNNLLELRKDEEYRKHLGGKCREWVKKTHNPDLVAQKHLEVLEKVFNST